MAIKKNGMLIAASISALLGVATLIGGTYALFTDSATVSNHLKAGNLKVSLLRTSLSKTSLDESGYLKETTDKTEKDFTGKNKENVFGLEENEYVVPGSSFTANMRIVNGIKENGSYVKSTVAFSYDIKIVLGDSSDKELSEQLLITVGQGSYKASKTLSEFNDEAILSGVMETTDESADFWVKAEFQDLEENNDAQNQKASFDLLVEATQLTKKS